MKIVEETRKVYRVFNERLFASRLPEIEVLVDLKRRGSVRFDAGLAEIVIGPGAGSLDEDGYLCELLHEMVHVDNKAKGVADVRHDYHNKKFRDAALKVGLAVIKTKALGWGTTTIGQRPKNLVSLTPEEQDAGRRVEAFTKTKISAQALTELRQTVNSVCRQRDGFYTLKYQCKCPPPYNSIRSGRRPHGPHPLNVFCQDCKQMFVCVEEWMEDVDQIK
jgi:hypothetical protein